MRNPPDEAFAECSFESLSEQCSRMRSWLQSLEGSTPFGHEFYTTTSFVVRALGLDGEPTGAPFSMGADQVDMSRWPYRFAPTLPTMAPTKKYGLVQIVQLHREPDTLRFYAYTQSTSLAEIRCRDIWNTVVGWQVYVHLAVSSESLAEAVGSFLAVTRRHNINGNLSMKNLLSCLAN